MTKSIVQMSLIALLAAVIVTTAVTAGAQAQPAAKTDTNAPAASTPKKEKARLFWNGKLTAMDKKAMTVTVKKKDTEKTFLVTSETKIRKAGEAAEFEEGVIGEDASVSYHKTADTNAVIKAISIRYGPSDKQRAEQPGSSTNKTDTVKPE
jgi:hypothetical protein